MYSLLIVDDETNIRNGIKNCCEWKSLNISDVRTATSGTEALEKMNEHPCDILLTDVRMPGISGIDLIRIVSQRYPDTLCAILSGYDDFTYAQQAIRYGTCKYLLKPCSADDIQGTMVKMIEQLAQREVRLKYLSSLEERVESMQHSLCAQVMKDYITNAAVTFEQIAGQADFGALISKNLRMLVFRIDHGSDTLCLQSLKEIFDNRMEEQRHQVFLSSYFNNQLITLLTWYPFETLTKDLEAIRGVYTQFHDNTITIAVSNKIVLHHIRKTYLHLLACMESAFYNNKEHLIVAGDLPHNEERNPFEIPNQQRLLSAIQGGNREKATELLGELISILDNPCYAIAEVKAYMIDLYVSICKLGGSEYILGSLKQVNLITASHSLRTIYNILAKTTGDIADRNRSLLARQYSELVVQAMAAMRENLDNENVSLTYIARKILFVNPDYLGRLFQQDTGERFTKSLTGMRMARAKELLVADHEMQITSVAERCGFGSSVQYFCRVFKKHTGITPTEYQGLFKVRQDKL